MQRPRGAVRAFGGDDGAGRFLQPGGKRRMVGMGMADEDVADRPPADCREQGLEMRLVLGTRIDDGERIAPDDVAVGAVERERAGVVDREARDIFAGRNGLAIGRIEPAVEFKIGHLAFRCPCSQTLPLADLLITSFADIGKEGSLLPYGS